MTKLLSIAVAIATVAGGLIGIRAWQARATTPVAASQVNVGWTDSTSKPIRVRFEGGDDFRETSSSWVGTKSLAGRFASTIVVIRFDTAEFPIQLLMRSEQASISFSVTKPQVENCALGVVNAINSAQPATDNERIALMIRARALISGNTCDGFQNRKLARRYFEMNCRLAENANANFEVSRDARDILLRFALSQADRNEAMQCNGVAQQRSISRLFDLARQAKATRNSALLKEIVDELAAHAADPNWADGVAGYGLTKTKINVLVVDDLYDRQKQAYMEGDFGQAIQLNDRLVDLSAIEEFRDSFRAVKINDERLSDDRAAILGARSASE